MRYPTALMSLDVTPVGVVRSSLKDLHDAPMQGFEGAPDAFIDILPAFVACAHRIAVGDELLLLTWLDRAQRDVMQVHPRDNPNIPLTGVFATRSPDRPNPIGLHRVTVLAIAGDHTMKVGPLEAIDGTPIVDIKPVLRELPDATGADAKGPTASAMARASASAGAAARETITTSIAPWLAVRSCARAVAFYKAAFGATERYRLDAPDGSPIVVQLAVGDAGSDGGSSPGVVFWVGDEPPAAGVTTPESLGGGSVRLILTVADAHAAFARALAAGASQVYPIGDAHGWRLGRVVDPFGLHWEIGHQLSA